MMTEGHTVTFTCVKGVPDGTQYQGASYNAQLGLFLIKVKHDSFSEVAEGTEIPPLLAEFRTEWADT